MKHQIRTHNNGRRPRYQELRRENRKLLEQCMYAEVELARQAEMIRALVRENGRLREELHELLAHQARSSTT